MTDPVGRNIWGWKGPLADSYWAAAALVLCALVPFLALSTALTPVQALIGPSVRLGPGGMGMSAGIANAAYCFGTILAVQIVARLPGRRVLLVCGVMLTVGSLLSASSSSPVLFFAGRVLQGLSTSMMLITAVPVLVLGFPTWRMRQTAVVMNMGIFGAVALGPLIGEAFVGLGDWRLLFWIAAVTGALALVLMVLTFDDVPATDPGSKLNLTSLGLASVGCVAAFYGASNLVGHGLASAIVLGPIVLGVLCVAGLLLQQMFVSDPLIPVRELGHTIPVAATALAMFAGAGSVGLIGVLQLIVSELHLSAAIFWPQFGGAVVAAVVFGRLFFTRQVPALACGGLAVLVAAGAFMSLVLGGGPVMLAISTGGIGVGVGAAVAPGLFVAGFAVPAPLLPRMYALVEMLRGVAAFLAAPVIVQIVLSSGPSLTAGARVGSWVATAVLAVGLALVMAMAVTGGVRLEVPRIAAWQRNETLALASPPLGAALRRRLRGASGQPVAPAPSPEPTDVRGE